MKNNSRLTPLPKNRTWKHFVKKDESMFHLDDKKWRQRFALAILVWAEKENSLVIDNFAFEMCMERQKLYDWAKQYTDIGEALAMAKLMIAARRYKGVLEGKFDRFSAFLNMHLYDPEWDDYLTRFDSEDIDEETLKAIYDATDSKIARVRNRAKPTEH